MITALLARLGILYNSHKCVQAVIVLMDNYPPVYRILGDLKFVTDLGLLGVLSPNIAPVFVHLVRISRYRAYVCSFSQNIEKPHQKFQKSTPTIFNLKTDFLITGGAFKCWNALSVVVELRKPTGSELVAAYW